MHTVSERKELRVGLQVEPAALNDYQKKLLEWTSPGFDTRVHISDPKTGQLLRYQPYRRVVDGGNAVYYRKDESGVERRYSEQGHSLDERKAGAHDKRVS